MCLCLGMANRLRTCFKLEQGCVCLCLGMASWLCTCFKLKQVCVCVCVFVFRHGQPAAHVL